MQEFGKRSRWLLAASTLALCSLAASPSWAADEPNTATSTGDTTASVEEVVVTAQRRAERLEDVPMSVTAVSGMAIEKAGVKSILDLSSIATGVQVNFAGAATQPSIRGITSLTNAVGYENNVAIYVDGFYEPDMLTINSDLANVASIQVLKGPQGALYGRNATGGAILINTLEPSKYLTGRFEASYATFNEITGSGYLSGPISDRIRYSIAGYSRSTDGYIKFVQPGRSGHPAPVKQQSVRAKLQADVTDKLTATLGYNYGLSDDPRGVLFTTFQYLPSFLPPAPELGEVAYNWNSVNRGITNEYTLTLAYDTAVGKLTSYTGYALRHTAQEFDFDGTYVDRTSSYFRFKEDTFQQGVDLAVDTIKRLDLVVGANYFYDEVRTYGPHRQGYGADRTPTNSLHFDQKSDAVAVYADATYHVTDALSVNLGGRYATEKKRISFILIGTGAFPETTASKRWSRFTPRVSVRYQLAPRTNIYATYSEGFRSGAWPTTITRPSLLIPIQQEIVDNYEVGYKTAQGRFSFDAAAFYSSDKNLQVAVVTPVCVGTTCTPTGITSNAPKASVYGVEAQLTFTPIEPLRIRAGATYLHARYDDFPNATGNGLNATTGVNISGQEQDWSGHQMARAPEFTGSVGVEYDVPIQTGSLLFAINANYSSSYVISNPSLYGPSAGALADTQRYRTGPYTLVNAQTTWTDPSDHYTVKLFVQNLTDEDYLLAYNGGSYGDYMLPNTPRQVGIQLGYHF